MIKGLHDLYHACHEDMNIHMAHVYAIIIPQQ